MRGTGPTVTPIAPTTLRRAPRRRQDGLAVEGVARAQAPNQIGSIVRNVTPCFPLSLFLSFRPPVSLYLYHDFSFLCPLTSQRLFPWIFPSHLTTVSSSSSLQIGLRLRDFFLRFLRFFFSAFLPPPQPLARSFFFACFFLLPFCFSTPRPPSSVYRECTLPSGQHVSFILAEHPFRIFFPLLPFPLHDRFLFPSRSLSLPLCAITTPHTGTRFCLSFSVFVLGCSCVLPASSALSVLPFSRPPFFL